MEKQKVIEMLNDLYENLEKELVKTKPAALRAVSAKIDEILELLQEEVENE